MTFKDSQDAFSLAIRQGRLSSVPSAANYAGRYMYMGTTDDGDDQFKHIDTRKYLLTSLEKRVERLHTAESLRIQDMGLDHSDADEGL